MCEPFDLVLDFFDFLFDRAAWRQMKGPMALATAVLGTAFGIVFAFIGAAAFVQAASWSSRLGALAFAAIGVYLLGNILIGVIAFLRAGGSQK